MQCNWPIHYDRVFRLLEGLRSHGHNRWSSLCPSHPDTHQSLSIAIGDNGALLLKCHAPHGCSLRSILHYLRITTDDVFPTKRARKRMNVIKIYDYRDEANKLLFQAIRCDPKDFRQRRVNPAFDAGKPSSKENPEYIYSLEGVRRVLYRLPELLASLKEKPGRWIVIVEGEKDCDLCWEHGIAATTNPMGALKWLRDYNDTLRDCNVCVIPDEDPFDQKLNCSPGCRHAEEVADSLHGIAKCVKVVRLPSVPAKGDFSEWWNLPETKTLSVGDRKKLLIAMIANAPEWKRGDHLTPREFTTSSKTTTASTTKPAGGESGWDGEISHGLQQIAETANYLRKSCKVKTSSMPQLSARLFTEIGALSTELTADAPSQEHIQRTLAAIGAYAVRGLEDFMPKEAKHG